MSRLRRCRALRPRPGRCAACAMARASSMRPWWAAMTAAGNSSGGDQPTELRREIQRLGRVAVGLLPVPRPPLEEAQDTTASTLRLAGSFRACSASQDLVEQRPRAARSRADQQQLRAQTYRSDRSSSGHAGKRSLECERLLHLGVRDAASGVEVHECRTTASARQLECDVVGPRGGATASVARARGHARVPSRRNASASARSTVDRRLERIVAFRFRRAPRGRAPLPLCGSASDSTSPSCDDDRGRSSPGAASAAPARAGLSRGRVAGAVCLSAARNRRRRASSGARVRREPERLLRRARRPPPARREPAPLGRPSSRIEAISRSGSAVASARWRARSSADGTSVGEPCVQRPAARRGLACDDRRAEQRMGEAHVLAVELEDPRVERLGEPGRSARRAPLPGARPSGRRALRQRARPRAPRAEAVDARAQELVEARRESGARRRARACRLCAGARRSSSAKNGLPPEVSQSLISVGRGNVASRRARSSSWVAPRLRPATSTVAVAPRARRGEATPAPRRGPPAGRRPARRRGGRARSGAPRATRRRATGRRRPRGRADRRAASSRNAPRKAAATARSSACDLRLAEQQRRLERPPLDRRELRQDVAERQRRGDRPARRTRTGSRPPTGREDRIR